MSLMWLQDFESVLLGESAGVQTEPQHQPGMQGNPHCTQAFLHSQYPNPHQETFKYQEQFGLDFQYGPQVKLESLTCSEQSAETQEWSAGTQASPYGGMPVKQEQTPYHGVPHRLDYSRSCEVGQEPHPYYPAHPYTSYNATFTICSATPNQRSYHPDGTFHHGSQETYQNNNVGGSSNNNNNNSQVVNQQSRLPGGFMTPPSSPHVSNLFLRPGVQGPATTGPTRVKRGRKRWGRKKTLRARLLPLRPPLPSHEATRFSMKTTSSSLYLFKAHHPLQQ
ncbi:unnamed protein product [Darwinula stevensoni]|uniref:Uncharacterized protein n=1 Tax=Darwinula stevensoni TaxID=69355 RepID=A0A7R9A810_9CRUS|nr:unnamed protein product [Darwinula stevensoni]CAG0894450.1 unnamed protein product [Darwinula stevensoni]